MIVALVMGKKNSKAFPSKNLYPVLGKPLMAYPLLAAKNSKYIDRCYVTTDDPQIEKVAKHYGCHIIKRPAHLCTKGALGEDVYAHGYQWIKTHAGEPIELVVLLMCNAAMVTCQLIDGGIEILRQRPELDSTVTVSRYNMWSPVRARKIDKGGLLKPFIPQLMSTKKIKISSNRDSQGDVWFADMGVSIVKPRCLEKIKEGLLPQRWMGKKIYPLKQCGGFDVDYEWQIPLLEYWLSTNKVSDLGADPRGKSALHRIKYKIAIVDPKNWTRG